MTNYRCSNKWERRIKSFFKYGITTMKNFFKDVFTIIENIMVIMAIMVFTRVKEKGMSVNQSLTSLLEIPATQKIVI